MLQFSKSQIDKLGERLRRPNSTEEDVRLLDAFRLSFAEPYEEVVDRVTRELQLQTTGRPAKSTSSIVDKLRRETIRLSQIQDIAGCRIIAQDIAQQNEIVERLRNLYDQATVIDRREQPSHGYRAVHVVLNCSGKLIEVQVRTALQHRWAELSEKFSDNIDPAIKYGGGNESLVKALAVASDDIRTAEVTEAGVNSELLNAQRRHAERRLALLAELFW
jgi:putative GTP pyrophosphokinase